MSTKSKKLLMQVVESIINGKNDVATKSLSEALNLMSRKVYKESMGMDDMPGQDDLDMSDEMPADDEAPEDDGTVTAAVMDRNDDGDLDVHVVEVPADDLESINLDDILRLGAGDDTEEPVGDDEEPMDELPDEEMADEPVDDEEPVDGEEELAADDSEPAGDDPVDDEEPPAEEEPVEGEEDDKEDSYMPEAFKMKKLSSKKFKMTKVSLKN